MRPLAGAIRNKLQWAPHHLGQMLTFVPNLNYFRNLLYPTDAALSFFSNNLLH